MQYDKYLVRDIEVCKIDGPTVKKFYNITGFYNIGNDWIYNSQWKVTSNGEATNVFTESIHLRTRSNKLYRHSELNYIHLKWYYKRTLCCRLLLITLIYPQYLTNVIAGLFISYTLHHFWCIKVLAYVKWWVRNDTQKVYLL